MQSTKAAMQIDLKKKGGSESRPEIKGTFAGASASARATLGRGVVPRDPLPREEPPRELDDAPIEPPLFLGAMRSMKIREIKENWVFSCGFGQNARIKMINVRLIEEDNSNLYKMTLAFQKVK